MARCGSIVVKLGGPVSDAPGEVVGRGGVREVSYAENRISWSCPCSSSSFLSGSSRRSGGRWV